tara:strand:+ start:1203 stop:1391 length:189 start_codon:yes stop_codon:yes gene_type:complete
MSKDIKVIFKGNKTPSGYNSNTEYYIGKKYLSNLEKDGRFGIEVLEKPKPKKKKEVSKKESK